MISHKPPQSASLGCTIVPPLVEFFILLHTLRRGTLLDIGSGDGRIVSVSVLYSLVSNDLKEYV
jgi:hypothetical protein